MNRPHIKSRTIYLIENLLNGRIEKAASEGKLTDAIRANLEAMKCKMLHVAHQQPVEFFESTWSGSDIDVIRLAMKKLQPLVEAA